ncbi:hypothetical protein GALL_430990 [mine drainage metagenome]|uniref:Uncharacterized protein n=1 Tax=mine drainage metagenome TaxID=410659 RepID=A0A1J5PWG5_9ZZZZ
MSRMLMVLETRLLTSTCRPSAIERKLCAASPVTMRLMMVWVRGSTAATALLPVSATSRVLSFGVSHRPAGVSPTFIVHSTVWVGRSMAATELLPCRLT